jgi:hypothetical protein
MLTDEFRIYYTALTFVIFLPSAYLSIAFAIAGVIKYIIQKVKRR